MSKQVYVGVSGGVDSAVTAYLLKKEGYDVTGIFMKNWSGEDYGIDDLCPWEEDLKSAIKVCEFLDIPQKTFNFEKEYRDLVISDFFKQYEVGNTPNPDILCNKFIKFDAFLNKCLDDGADLIATGHYAITKNGRLFRPKDPKKDQTYFLSGVKGEQLKKSLFPLGDFTKSEIRKIANDINLPNANRPDSQGICFIGEVDIQKFLSQKLQKKNGDIIDLESKEKVGEHNGVWFYTQGQRKGLGIGGAAKPYFVHSKDVSKNELYVVMGHDNPKLWPTKLNFKNIHLINQNDLIPDSCAVQIRHRGKPVNAKVSIDYNKDSGYAKLEKGIWAPAPAQAIVFYKDDICYGYSDLT